MERWRREWCAVYSLVKIGKWSDGEQWVTDTDGASEESEEVITRSRIFSLVVSWEIYMLS